MTNTDHLLTQLRAEIDRLDDDLLRLLNQRARLSQQIGNAKNTLDKNTTVPSSEPDNPQSSPLPAPTSSVLRPERESAVVRRLLKNNPGPLPESALRNIYREIFSASVAIQKPIRVACLGPRGTFSEEGAISQFGHSAELVFYASFDEIFHATESGSTDYAIVPVENSTEGVVARNLDLLLTSSLQVCAEWVIKVSQNLLRAIPGTEGIRRICAHPQSLAQTQTWLNRHFPHIERMAVPSNSRAAEMSQEDPEIAAVAGINAARHFNLQVLSTNIEDDTDNRTRFVVLGHHSANPSSEMSLDRTWIVMSAPNRPGAVHALLTPFAEQGVSMTRLESRPSRMRSMPGAWEYLFYVELEGHQQNPILSRALEAVKEKAPYLKIFGSYPVSPPVSPPASIALPT